MSYLDQLNEQQKQAVTASLGSIVVLAGAGTGKTHVLTSRFMYVVQTYHYDPKHILAITFTNKAANEMKERIQKAIHVTGLYNICTFHALCLRILKEDIKYLNRSTKFNVIDEEDQLNLLKEIYADKGIETKDLPTKRMLYLIENWKSKEYNEKHFDDVVDDYNDYGFASKGGIKIAFDIYLSFLKKQLALNLLDFNDLLFLAKKLLISNDEVRQKWRSRFAYILIDEFQDINEVQLSIISQLLNDHKDLFCVGDPDQTIYTWRGAKENIMEDLYAICPNTKTLKLEQNYRSTQLILDASNAVIAQNINRIAKNLYTKNGEGEKIKYFVATDENEEAVFLVNKIIDLLRSKQTSPNQICVLYRSKHLSRSIEQVLISSNVKYRIIGGYKFYSRKEIKDLIAYLKVIDNNDELSLKRIANVPRRKISDETLSKLSEYANLHNISLFKAFSFVKEINDLSSVAINSCLKFHELIMNLKQYANKQNHHTITEIFDYVYTQSGYDVYLKQNSDKVDREEYVVELKQSINYYCENHKNQDITLSDYLQDIALFTSMSDEVDANKDCVLLMTVHQAKGLEFDYVFIFSFNDDVFPSQKATQEQRLEEERRIAYVAMTRARKQLYISMNEGYSIRTKMYRKPSRFFNDIDPKILDQQKRSTKKLHNQGQNEWYDSMQKIDKEAMYSNEPIDLVVGDIIVHEKFGQGTVLEVNNKTAKIFFNNSSCKGVKELDKHHKSILRKII